MEFLAKYSFETVRISKPWVRLQSEHSIRECLAELVGIERKTTVFACSGIRQNSMHLQDFWRSPLRHLLTARC